MSNKHTPGPLDIEPVYVREDSDEVAHYYVYAKADDGAWIEVADGIEKEGDARLFAAAPDLLAAAKRVLAHLNLRIDAASEHGEPAPVFDGVADLHTAIAKAEGRHD